MKLFIFFIPINATPYGKTSCIDLCYWVDYALVTMYYFVGGYIATRIALNMLRLVWLGPLRMIFTLEYFNVFRKDRETSTTGGGYSKYPKLISSQLI